MAHHAQLSILRACKSSLPVSRSSVSVRHNHLILSSNAIQVRSIVFATPTLHQDTHLQSPRGSQIPPLLSPSAEETKTPQPITKDELQRYIYPLLCHGWMLNTDSTTNNGLCLSRKMVMKGPVSARKFIKQIFAIEDSLSHHVTSLNLDGERRPNLTIVAQTHDLERPWLSLRDASLASSLETIYRAEGYGVFKGRPAQPPILFDLATWEELLSDYPWNFERVQIENNQLIRL
ncbi:hypothetical protein BDN70DRAFT_996888 [Pholiota conissans]|uniref:Uncharacterized protein n=1 Tax=Pholiota conissans TaxID=109636 RepID=A0A9P5YRU4_9AGAR|nr:hypothetical protein BDN70DRAFT_996888 [Pholiota conissans]